MIVFMLRKKLLGLMSWDKLLAFIAHFGIRCDGFQHLTKYYFIEIINYSFRFNYLALLKFL